MIFILFITITYTVLIFWLFVGIGKVPEFHWSENTLKTKFSIIIPFRNEAENLPDLLHSISQLNYNKKLFEILLVNDDSDDDSVQIIKNYFENYLDIDFTIIDAIRQSNSPKKDAITTAINKSQYPWIITTDADCALPEKWLQVYDAFIQNNKPVFIAAPVIFKNEKGFLKQFQQLDWMSLTAVTMGGFGQQKPLLCSGANLAYTKEAFKTVEGFQGNDTFASGDDVFLLQKMQKEFNSKVSFLNNTEVIVQTKPEDTWSDLWQQRVRWAGKTGKLPNILVRLIGVVVILMNILLLYSLMAIFFVSDNWVVLWVTFSTKFVVDALLSYKIANVLKQKTPFLTYVAGSIFYPFFSVSVGIVSVFSGYRWKNRKFDK
jgi:cellulose synthase/poly-beta-1,6-N-acetylglucosamine synthase-like glycosyltransferase